MRTLKCVKLKLQDELTQKIRQLTAEMTSNDKMKEELDRLRAQEDVASQIQYHEKVLRAEYLAMKVRYETRLENLQKEHMKLLGVLDKLQREKVLNQEMIKGVQKGMGTMKETYTKDLEHWKEERNVLEKHIKEIESSRKLAAELERKVEELKQQLADQEYERAEIINRMTTERSKWELERSGMQSHMNQLEEKLETVAYSQYRTKDMQSRMEVAWESERAEQKRLLNEAHELAMDLQRQLKCRDDEHSRERRALLEQLKKLRKELDEEQMLREKRLKQIETSKRETEDLKTKLKEMCQRSEKDHEVSMKERVDLVRRLAGFRRSHKRDQRRIEDVLSE
nr:myosin-9-like [Crassostrea gigas]|eukprot:XP_019927288.1 PREDICTED: paramyosin-like isoform X2 [Crassostrea gigas]